MVDDVTKEGDVPAIPPSNPRNAFDETGAPRNPAVFHPFQSQGFPDNDGKMASEPVYAPGVELTPAGYPTGKQVMVRREGVNKPHDIPDSELPPEQRSDISYRQRYEEENPEAVIEDISEPKGQPVDKFGFPLRRGAAPDAQDTGMFNPDNPDRIQKSDRYLGVEKPGDGVGDAGMARTASRMSPGEGAIGDQGDVKYPPTVVGAERVEEPKSAAEAQGSSAIPPSEAGHIPENRLPEYDETYKLHPVPAKEDAVVAEGGKPIEERPPTEPIDGGETPPDGGDGSETPVEPVP